MPRSSIIATIGPASCSPDVIKGIALAGSKIFRLNFSHGHHDFHKECASNIREVERSTGISLSILMDLQGPKLRIGCFSDGKVSLTTGARFILDLCPDAGNSTRVPFPHPEIFDSLLDGTPIFLDDGKIKLSVLNNDGNSIETEILEGGILSNKKGVNIPSIVLPISALTEKDVSDLAIVNDITADWIAVSFVQSADDVIRARSLIGPDFGIVAKIEKPVAIDNIDSILEVSDAVMVARGDLGVEIPFESIPAAQMVITKRALYHKKPVIVATQMLESMIHCHVPTRAEVTDVAFAVGCGADAVMLSAETASGEHPVDTVETMRKITLQSEKSNLHFIEADDSHLTAMAKTVKTAVETACIPFVFVFTESGKTAIEISNSRLNSKIIALTPNPKTVHKLHLAWGVTAFVIDEIFSFSQLIQIAQDISCKHFGAANGDNIAIVSGMPFRLSGAINILHIFEIKSNPEQ
ncbi:MAG: pyruvate kinase [Holosporales bacterium]|jgi:pyruvate kinase|nr:pyruvate kinase [Holosporales bacterium]